MKNRLLLYAEIRDGYGDVTSCSFLDTLSEVIGWFRERGIDFKNVGFNGQSEYSYKAIRFIIQ